MLDAKELAKRLRTAMDNRIPRMQNIELATACGVSRQAAYEWRETGRIGKQHLMNIAKATGMPLEYYLEETRGETPATRSIWKALAKLAAKAAMVAALSLGVLSSHPAQEVDFVAAQPWCVLCKILRSAWQRLRRFLVPTYSRCPIF